MSEIAKNLSGLPMRELIASPLIAVSEAQTMLATQSFDFMNKIGFDQDKKPRMLDFTLERPVRNAGNGVTTNQIQVHAPLLGLVPAPNLLVEDVHIDFQMEVTMADSSKESTQAEVSTDISYKSWFGLKVDVQGKVTTSRENTRSTNQTAKYQVSVNARQQPPTEGMSKLMDILASCVEPIDAGGGSN